jgi:hypothetical protein
MPKTNTEPTKNHPVQEYRIGLLKAAIWANQTEDGVRHNVTFERSYKDGENWKSSTAFGRDDLLALAKLADQAHSWIIQPATDGRAKRVDLRKGTLPAAGE